MKINGHRMVSLVPAIVLAGCNVLHDDWSYYRCAPDQLSSVERQTAACSAAGWEKAYCYSRAVIAFCELPGKGGAASAELAKEQTNAK